MTGDGRLLSDIGHNLAVLNEKMRGLEEETCGFDRRHKKGVIIEQVKGKMRAEENTIDTRVEIRARLVAFQEVHTSTCDK